MSPLHLAHDAEDDGHEQMERELRERIAGHADASPDDPAIIGLARTVLSMPSHRNGVTDAGVKALAQSVREYIADVRPEREAAAARGLHHPSEAPSVAGAAFLQRAHGAALLMVAAAHGPGLVAHTDMREPGLYEARSLAEIKRRAGDSAVQSRARRRRRLSWWERAPMVAACLVIGGLAIAVLAYGWLFG